MLERTLLWLVDDCFLAALVEAGLKVLQQCDERVTEKIQVYKGFVIFEWNDGRKTDKMRIAVFFLVGK